MSTQTVSLKIEGSKATVQIERPEALNALNEEVLTQLHQIVNGLAARDDVHVVTLAGSGDKAFVAGADIKFMQGLSASQAEKFSKLGSQIFSSIEALPQVVVARVQGFALGGGLELALSADFIVASSKARFGLPEVSLGLIPGFGGTQRLTRRIGRARAIEWMTTAEKYNAEQALAAGLVNHVVPHEELVTFTESLANQILRNGPFAVRAAKQAAVKGAECAMHAALDLESAIFGLRFSTPEAKEGMLAFVEKRAPKF